VTIRAGPDVQPWVLRVAILGVIDTLASLEAPVTLTIIAAPRPHT
jgi:hypothetical protein